jgi:hypothetical protein
MLSRPEVPSPHGVQFLGYPKSAPDQTPLIGGVSLLPLKPDRLIERHVPRSFEPFQALKVGIGS